MSERRTVPTVPSSARDQPAVRETVVTGDLPAGSTDPRTPSGLSGAATPIPASSGVLDTTAEWQERARLIAELTLFRDVAAETVERMPLGFVALDNRLHVTYANPVALVLVGTSLAELVGRRPWDLFPQIVGTRYQTVRVSAAVTVEYEEQIGPRERWVGVLAFPTQTGTAVFLRDITGAAAACDGC